MTVEKTPKAVAALLQKFNMTANSNNEKFLSFYNRLLMEMEKENQISYEEYQERQERIYNNKVNHGFNLTNPYQEIRYITEETAELMRAIELNDKDNMAEELADIIIFAYGLSSILGIENLDAKIFEKMQINEQRKYTKKSESDFEKIE